MTTLTINGKTQEVVSAASTPLLYVLRDELGLHGAKYGCGLGQCSACLVLIDGEPVVSCVMPSGALEGRHVTSLEGLSASGALAKLQAAFTREQAAQCGYCTSGMLVRAYGLLRKNPKPTDAQIREALQMNLCRCGSHMRVIRAVRRAAETVAKTS